MLGPPEQAHPGAVARAARRGRPDPAGHRAAGPRVRLAGAPVLALNVEVILTHPCIFHY